MGRDKASLRLGSPLPDQAPTLAGRTAGILSAVCSPLVEVGPGRSGLPAVREEPPGRGPLAAIAAGWASLTADGWRGPVVVVATDLPRLTQAMLTWLAGYPGDRSVVPVSAGRVQPLCARYSPADMDTASRLAADGYRAMRELLEATDPRMVGEQEWAPVAGGTDVLDDVDTPEDLRRVTGP
jgi:molybdopterin-guanine dinucleotide biosynthesis protein A